MEVPAVDVLFGGIWTVEEVALTGDADNVSRAELSQMGGPPPNAPAKGDGMQLASHAVTVMYCISVVVIKEGKHVLAFAVGSGN